MKNLKILKREIASIRVLPNFDTNKRGLERSTLPFYERRLQLVLRVVILSIIFLVTWINGAVLPPVLLKTVEFRIVTHGTVYQLYRLFINYELNNPIRVVGSLYNQTNPHMDHSVISIDRMTRTSSQN
uniref:Uncharacterized protein n=1 Tax=Glossina austeni TaxID=7395 RepID=A0A1A9V4N4_GLOAU